MKKALLVGSLGLAACGMAWTETRAEGPLYTNASLLPDQIIEEMRALVDGNKSPEINTVIRLAYVLEANGRTAEAAHYFEIADGLNRNWRDNEANYTPQGGGRANNTGTRQDVWVCSIPGHAQYTGFGNPVNIGGTLYHAYSIATTSANQGNAILNWDPGTVAHPVITQNLYRLLNGRFEHIGQSMLKHGFCALQQGGCGTCKPVAGSCPPRLGPGCSDPYDASLNGTQARLGPKSEVAPHAGTYLLPHATPDTGGSWGSTLAGRLIVRQDALGLPGATYFWEGQYIHPEDAVDATFAGQTTNAFNNATYRGVAFSAAPNYAPSFVGASIQQVPAIHAWKAARPAVTLVNVDSTENGTAAAGSGASGTLAFPTRYIVGYEVIDNGNGTWRYEYAVFNMNSDKGVQQLSLPIGANVQITNAGMSSPFYHSGDGVQTAAPGRESYSNAAWAIDTTGGSIKWSSETLAQNVNANALRWGTMYTFWFTANTAPETVSGQFTHYKVAGTSSIPGLKGPSAAVDPCPADLDGDGSVGSSDLAALLGSWGAGGPADFDGGGVGSSDLAVLLGSWGPC